MILAPLSVNYTVRITLLETDHPGFAEPSLSSEACRRLISLGNTSHEKSGVNSGMSGITPPITSS